MIPSDTIRYRLVNPIPLLIPLKVDGIGCEARQKAEVIPLIPLIPSKTSTHAPARSGALIGGFAIRTAYGGKKRE